MNPVRLLDVDGVVNAFRAGWYSGPRLVLGSGRRLVWTDDAEIDHHAQDCSSWAASGWALPIGPNAGRGLRPRDLRRVRDFPRRPESPGG